MDDIVTKGRELARKHREIAYVDALCDEIERLQSQLDRIQPLLDLAVDVFNDFDASEYMQNPPSIQRVWELGKCEAEAADEAEQRPTCRHQTSRISDGKLRCGECNEWLAAADVEQETKR